MPTLLYRTIIDAYPYLQPVAYVLQIAGENEMTSVRRLRTTGFKQGGSGIYDDYPAPTEPAPFWMAPISQFANWDQYHLVLDRWNLDALQQVLVRVKPQLAIRRSVL